MTTYGRSYIFLFIFSEKHEVIDLLGVSSCQRTSYLVGCSLLQRARRQKETYNPLCAA